MARNVTPCPTCKEKTCFANEKGTCICLTDSNFGDRKCPFYKPKEEMQKQKLMLINKKNSKVKT